MARAKCVKLESMKFWETEMGSDHANWLILDGMMAK